LVSGRLVNDLPSLLAGPDLADERLRQAEVAVSADMLVELIGLEYQGRWQRGERPSRQEYLDRFPEHAEALRALQPRWTNTRAPPTRAPPTPPNGGAALPDRPEVLRQKVWK
jgi:hypothetical protein